MGNIHQGITNKYDLQQLCQRYASEEEICDGRNLDFISAAGALGEK